MSGSSGSGSGSGSGSARPGRPGVGSGDPSAPSTSLPLTADAPTNVSTLTGTAPPAARVDAATNAAGRSPSSLTSRPPTTSRASSIASSAAVSRPTVSMVPGRGTGAAALRGQPRMTFRPVMPQRRKPSDNTAGDVQVKQEPSSSSLSGSSDRGRGAGGFRRGASGGTRGGRKEVQLVASGPFSLGTGSTSRSDRLRQGNASRMGRGSGAGGGISAATGKWGTGGEGDLDDSEKLKPDPGRMAYRNPDKLREKEEYSDQDEDVEIVDLDDVGTLDELAPKALPRVQEKEKKKKEQQEGKVKGKGKGKGKIKTEEEAMHVDVKPDPEDEEERERMALAGHTSRATTISSGTSTPLHAANEADSGSDADEKDDHRGIDALDLSESEAEEIGDDLVDDFVFDEEDVDSNRLYLFQFPQLFPKFRMPKERSASVKTKEGSSDRSGGVKAAMGATVSALSSSPPGGSKSRRSVAFAEGTAGGNSPMSGTAGATSAGSSGAASNGVKREDGSSSTSTSTDSKANVKQEDKEAGENQLGPEGMIGRLQVYRDGRVEMHFGKIVMEVSGGSQTTFLQDLALLDPASHRATILGEVHRKFTVSPNVENMLDDMAEEEARLIRVKREGGQGGGSKGDSSSDDDDDGGGGGGNDV